MPFACCLAHYYSLISPILEMNIGVFINDKKQRLKFLYRVDVFGHRKILSSMSYYANDYDIATKEVMESKITPREKKDLLEDIKHPYTSRIYYYEVQLVTAMKIWMEKCDGNLIDKNITNISFNILSNSFKLGNLSYVKMELEIDNTFNLLKQKSKGAKRMKLHYLRDYSEVDKNKPSYISGNSLHKTYTTILYDDNVIYTEQNSKEFNELKIENATLKSRLVDNMLNRFFPDDLVKIIMDFDPMECSFVNDLLKLKFNYS